MICETEVRKSSQVWRRDCEWVYVYCNSEAWDAIFHLFMSRIILFCLIYVTTLISGIHWSDFFFPNTESVKLSSEEWRCWMNIADNDTAKIKYLISLIMSWRCISCIFNRSFCPQLQWGVGTFKVHSLWTNSSERVWCSSWRQWEVMKCYHGMTTCSLLLVLLFCRWGNNTTW